ncbi:MAG: Stp1/IreP family PP2C-type Ser/Thr phosphatase [Nitrospirota bacterium]
MNRLVSLSWQGTGFTDTGLVRLTNQDAFAVDNDLGLWIVADGMGGHAGGGTASQLAVKAVTDHLASSAVSSSDFRNRINQVEELLCSAVAVADSMIHATADTTPDLKGMGTTIVIGLFCPGPEPSIALAHIGDSRAYLIRDHCISALTTDHSFVQRLVSEGLISLEEARTHPQQNVLLRAVGVEDCLPPDVTIHPLQPHDVVILSTDGLTKMLEEQDILDYALASQGSSDQIGRQLIDAANARGGKDNTTVIVIAPTGQRAAPHHTTG